MTTELQTRRHLHTLRDLADRLARDAANNSPGINNPQRAKLGTRQSDQSFAIKWALREIAELRLQRDPLIEGPKQLLDDITGRAKL